MADSLQSKLFQDQVVLVTGAGRGLGRALALAFAQQGAIVAANDLTPIYLDETLALIQAAGGRAKDYVFDVAKKIPVQTMIQQVLADWERIDILVNNAWLAPQEALLDMDEWDWHRTVDVNLGGAFFALQQAGRIMRHQGGGVIVNIAVSEAWAQQIRGRAAFVASKLGLVGLARAAALELAADGIRVHAVCPAGLDRETAPDLGDQGLLDTPAVVRQVLALCAPQAAGLNGQMIEIKEV